MFMGKNGGFVENILYIRSKCLLLRRNCYEYMRMKRIFTILLSALFAASCSTDTFVPTNDGDGKIEIPVTAPFLGYENLSRTEQVNMVVWYGLDGKKLEKKL